MLYNIVFKAFQVSLSLIPGHTLSTRLIDREILMRQVLNLLAAIYLLG